MQEVNTFLESNQFHTKHVELYPIGDVSFASHLGYGCKKQPNDVPQTEDFGSLFTVGKYTVIIVCDGHGGQDASEHGTLHMQQVLQETIGTTDVVETLRFAFELVSNHLAKYVCGSTCTVCVVDDVENVAYIATLGDSPAWVFRRGHSSYHCVFKNYEQSASNPLEQERIRREDPKVIDDHSVGLGIDPRAATKVLRYHGLTTAGGLGDRYAGKGYTKRPYIEIFQLVPGDIIVVSSDGLLETVHSVTRYNSRTGVSKECPLIGADQDVEGRNELIAMDLTDFFSTGRPREDLALHLIKQQHARLGELIVKIDPSRSPESATTSCDNNHVYTYVFGSRSIR